MSSIVNDNFLQEIINEIGNQTLQKLNINIFNLDTYGAYSASVESTKNVFETYNQHKKNDKFYGTSFEELEAGYNNINDALHKRSHRTDRTDRVGNVNDPIRDRVTRDKHGNIISTSQDKVVKNSRDIMKDRYLDNDHITVPSDDYDKHKSYFENMAQNSKDEATREKAKEFSQKLKQGNFTREESQNPRSTSIKQQMKYAANHVGQTAVSDGINMALTTLASGFIVETRLYYSGKSNETILEHLSRLLKKTLEQFQNGVSRGGGFAGVDIIISTISGLFKSIFANIKSIWQKLRSSFKSIYNGIYDYITGKIETKAELFTIIIKSLSSAIAVFGIAIFETKLKFYVGDVLATVISIIIGSFIVVSIPKIVDYFMGLFNAATLAQKKASEIETICDQELPAIIEMQQTLEIEINQFFNTRTDRLNKSFAELNNVLDKNDYNLTYKPLNDINKEFGKELEWKTSSEFDDFMLSDKPLNL